MRENVTDVINQVPSYLSVYTCGSLCDTAEEVRAPRMDGPSQHERRTIVNIEDIIHAWRDEEYQHSLSAEQQALLPEHPAGSIELTDEELCEAAGAWSDFIVCSGAACSIPFTCGDPNNCPLQGLA